jgi:hypothetical protein
MIILVPNPNEPMTIANVGQMRCISEKTVVDLSRRVVLIPKDWNRYLKNLRADVPWTFVIIHIFF